ncbi:MAG: tRNA uridine-5-carboxymethylaminomethyl(34) synthesis enzyme MnmG [Thermodesulfovibrionales bacterium]|nr:tRNA uridine-5-carboxymethylaminomethyl(34) synthesis enzyme MnmG [Thermodesulfovibrionales bacterium]
MFQEATYDVIVIGAGHAGCEAALASARLGLKTCLFTINIDSIGHMSCNPAIGGLAKGHLVREIDALGGEMARVADKAGIQFRMLNLSKGPAVWALRSQADRGLYKLHMRKTIEEQPNLTVKQSIIEKIIVEDGIVSGVVNNLGVFYETKAVIVTTGTFLKGLIHIGLDSFTAGRAGEFAAIGLSDSLASLGLQIGRLKTRNPPRLDSKSIDFSQMEIQYGDDPPIPFSYSTDKITNSQLPCFITYTNMKTHEIIKSNLDRSPLYGGIIKGVGPRYCPSIEDKVMRFSDKERHQVFLEPEGLDTKEYYANGISTSLPYDVQIKIVRSIPGLQVAEIMRPAYAIEYDFVLPTELYHSLETKKIKGLYLAGQINGTSGYEEAAAQGLMAGINASLKILGKEPLILMRDEAYIGVLIDDLVTKGTNEPYRMFTSRAEYRLLLRHDNADDRLMKKGFEIGLLKKEIYDEYVDRYEIVHREITRLKNTRVFPSTELNQRLIDKNTSSITEATTLDKLLKRPEINYDFIDSISPQGLPNKVKQLVEINVKYEGYIAKQKELADKMRSLEKRLIPKDFVYQGIPGLSREVVEKLTQIRPQSIGQAGRIQGITPAALSILLVAVDKYWREKSS